MHQEVTAWEVIAAIATAFAALFTAWLGWSTRKLARETRQTLSAEWMPVLTLGQLSAVGTQGALVKIESMDEGQSTLFTHDLNVKNIGSGPALNAHIQILPGVISSAATELRGRGNMGSGCLAIGIFGKDESAFWSIKSREPIVYRGENTHYTVIITYQDIERMGFETTHTLYAEGGAFPPGSSLEVRAKVRETELHQTGERVRESAARITMSLSRQSRYYHRLRNTIMRVDQMLQRRNRKVRDALSRADRYLQHKTAQTSNKDRE